MKDKIKSVVKVVLPLIASALIFLPIVIYLIALNWHKDHLQALLIFVSMFFLYIVAIRLLFIQEWERYEKIIFYVIFSIINFFVFLFTAFYSLGFYDDFYDYGIKKTLLSKIVYYFLPRSFFVSIFVFFFVIVMLIDNIIRQGDVLFAKNWLIITLISAVITIAVTILILNRNPNFF